MVKRFSTVRDNLRGSQRYMKNRRRRKEIEVSRRRERVFSKCSPYPRHPQRFTELDWEEKGKGGNRGVLR